MVFLLLYHSALARALQKAMSPYHKNWYFVLVLKSPEAKFQDKFSWLFFNVWASLVSVLSLATVNND